MKTKIYSYYFDVSINEQKEQYNALCAKLKAQGLECFESWGGNSHYMPEWQGRTIELDEKNVFNNQWNAAPIEEPEKGRRVFDWAQDYMVTGNKNIKKGHYLHITEKMKAIRDNTHKCGYCGAYEPAQKGYAFCPHCLDSEYLEKGQLHLTRMQAVSNDNERAPLSSAEKDHLYPLYKKAQLEGTTKRGKARLAKQKQDIEAKYKKAIESAESEYNGAKWIADNCPGLLQNWIYYSHTGKHCFGWRTPLSEEVCNDLLDIISEFPYSYEIKAEHKVYDSGTC